MTSIQKMMLVKVLAGMAAVCLFAGVANAEPAYKGKFTLPCEVHWGKAVLPAGQYEITLKSPSLPLVATIHGDKSGDTFVMPVSASRTSASGRNTLVISTRGSQSTVRFLRLADLGLVLNYQPTPARRQAANEEAKAEQEIPIIAANK